MGPARQTIKIDALTALVIETVGNKVLTSVTVGGIKVFDKPTEYNTASVIASAYRRCAEQAAENELLA